MVSSYLLFTLLFILQCSRLHTCGIAVHNEITHRSIENYFPESSIQQSYKDDILDSPAYTQAGSFFPDWGYQCLGYNQQSEDAHWPTFIKTAVNYVREVYPLSRFHQDPHVKGLISFIFATMSHGMSDVKWHSLSGLSDYFIVAMANSDFHGNTNDAHLAADAGAEFTLKHSNTLSYMNETWQVPIKDIIEIYKRLYATEKKKRVPFASHLKYCMATAFAASKIDVELGNLMFGYYGSKSPFLIEEMYNYYKGGIEDMSASVTDCYSELIHAFEHGSRHTSPDTLCATYFYTSFNSSYSCLKNHIKPMINRSDMYKDYNSITGVLTLTINNKQKDRHHHDTTLFPIVQNHETKHLKRLFQSPFQTKTCQPVSDNEITFTLPMSSASLGHQFSSGDFNGNGQLDMAISAPYHLHTVSQQQTGTIFILNSTAMTSTSNDIRDVSISTLQGSLVHGRFGWSMITLDMNQDGIDDLAVATPFHSHTGKVEIYLGQSQLGLSRTPAISIQYQGWIPTILTAFDINGDHSKDLLIGCPLCTINNQPQVGIVYIFKSHVHLPKIMTQPDISIKNPNKNDNAYDHFGESILVIKDTILIGSPGYSIEKKQRVGRVYAFDINSFELKWTITGTAQFQQYGKVLATDNTQVLAISSPSEETIVGLKKYWQAGTVRIYDWNKLISSPQQDMGMEYGIISTIQGRTSAGHLGQSLSFFKENQQVGIWLGEPMSEQENGRVYRWLLNDQQMDCLKSEVILARFGSQIGSLGTDSICITSQRYGQNARYSGAVTFLSKGKAQ